MDFLIPEKFEYEYELIGTNTLLEAVVGDARL